MTTNNIIVKETEQDIYSPLQNATEKYLDFTLGIQSALVSSYVPTLLQQNNINLSGPAGDFLDLAIAIYTSDQIISRSTDGFQGWSRHIRVHFPVTSSLLWASVKDDLEEMLSFLSGDKWELIFRQRANVNVVQSQLVSNPNGISKVSLLSGGLDSFIGAIDMLEAKEKPAFVNHYKAL